MNLSSIIRSVPGSFLDFIFPPTCIACKRLLHDGSSKVCNECWNSIERITCDHPLYLETRERLLAAGIVSDLISQFVFQKEGAFQHIAHSLKYDGIESVGKELGRRLGKTMKEWGMMGDILVPIPLHKAKQRERGYNQAALIASGIASETGITVCPNLVFRTRYTQTQTQLDSDERRRNMENAFQLNRSCSIQVGGKICIIIDDVITTGATINSCAFELKKAGSPRIIAASAALAK